MPPVPSGMPALEEAASHHLLVLDEATDPDDVAALWASRRPDLTVAGDGALHLEDHVTVRGPYAVPRQPELPSWAGAVFAVHTPTERGQPVPAPLRGGGGLLDGFADAEVLGRERAALEEAFAIARRLGGAVRTAEPSGMLLIPEPRADLALFAPRWLDPDHLTETLLPVLATVEVAGPIADAPAAARPSLPAPGMDEGELRWLHAEADAFDEAALAQPLVTESYGATARLSGGALLAVAVEGATTVPRVLLSRPPSERAIVYEVRWYPAQQGDALPAWAFDVVDRAVAAIQARVGGAVVDDDGFLV